MKTALRIMGLFFICILLTSPVYSQTTNYFDLGDTVSIGKYSNNLATALTILGSSHKRIMVNGTVTLAADANAPDNIVLDVSENGLIILGNYDLFVHGDFRCEPGNRAFNVSGTGRVYFRGNIDRVYPEWFGALGDGSTDDSLAFECVMNTGSNNRDIPVVLGEKIYAISGLVCSSPMYGISNQKSILKITGGGLSLSPIGDERFIELHDFKIDGTSANYGACLLDFWDSRGYAKNIYMYTDGNNDLTGIRLRSSNHCNFQNILMYGGTGNGFNYGLHIDSDITNQVNHCSFSNIYIADSNFAIRVEQFQSNNVWAGTYLESCGTGVYFAGDIGSNFVGLWWDDVTTWLDCAYAGGNYSRINTDKTIRDVIDNSAGALDNLDIRGKGAHLIKRITQNSTKAFPISTDPNGSMPPEIRFYGWNRNSDSHYGYTQGGISFSLRPTYGKLTAFTYDDTTSIQYWELDPTSTTGYVKEKVMGANGEYFQTAIRSREITSMSGASATSSEAIGVGWRVLGVNTYVTDTITGSGVTGYAVGDGTDPNRWGDITGTAIGTSSDTTDYVDESVVIYDSLTGVVITAAGGTFTAGDIRIVIYFQELGAPTS